MSWGLFILGLVGTPIYLYRQRLSGQTWELNAALSTIAFALWAYTLGRSLVLIHHWYHVLLAGIAAPIFTFVAGWFEPKRRKTAVPTYVEIRAYFDESRRFKEFVSAAAGNPIVTGFQWCIRIWWRPAKRRIGGLAGEQVDEGFLLISETRRSHEGRTSAACRVLEAYSFRWRAYLLCVHRVHGKSFTIGHPSG